MRLRNTLILLLVLAGLGAYVYFVEYPAAQQEAKKKTLFEFAADDVTQVRLVYSDREIVLAKSGETWQLNQPVEAQADEVTVKSLLTTLAEIEVKRTLEEEPKDLAVFGLDAPMATITVTTKEKEWPAIKVGKAAPVGSSAYIQRADEPKVLLTTSTMRSNVDKKVKDLRDKSILRFEDDAVNRIEVVREGETVVLVKKDDAWRIEQPGSYPADATIVRSFLATLRGVRAVDFPADQPADLNEYGLDAPRLAITASIGTEGDTRQLLVGKDSSENQTYVKSGAKPTVYAVNQWVFRDLNKSLGDFRDKTLLAFDQAAIKAIEVKRQDGETFKLARPEGGDWAIEGSDAKTAQRTATQFVTDLHDLKGYEVAADNTADLAPFGLAEPLLAVTVFGADSAPLGTILIGTREHEEKKDYTATTAGGPTVFRVRDYLFTRLDKRQRDFVEQPTPSPAPVTPGAEIPADGGGDEEYKDEYEDVDEEEM